MKKLSLLFLTMICKAQVSYPVSPLPYYSQDGQDRFLHQKFFKNKREGTFFEIGAHDGITRSNLYYFEKNLKWKGICVEPHPDRFNELKKNRNCICINGCIFNNEGTADFLQINGYSEMLSGITVTYDEKHKKRIDSEIKKFGGKKKIIKTPTFTFNQICKKTNFNHFDIVSIDVEGSEKIILKSIDFNEINIDFIIIENNYNGNEIKNFLAKKGYKLVKKIGGDEIYHLQNKKRST
jgi:FkbM family methyltransferase